MSQYDKLTLKDGSYLHFKDWGSGQPIVFSHGAEILPDAQLKVYTGGSHGICTTHKQQINGDLLSFIQS